MKTSLTEKTSYKKDERYITGHKDVDSMILNFIDDSDILSLMQIKNVNKKIRSILEGENFFEKRIETRYPSLVRFKRRKENWKDYYIRNMKDIKTLKKDFNLDYPHRGVNIKSPRYYISHLSKVKNKYNKNILKRDIISLAVRFAALEGYEKELFEKIERGIKEIELEEDKDIRDDDMIEILGEAVYTLFKERNIPLYLRLKERFKKYDDLFHFVVGSAFDSAIYSGDTKVIDFIFDEYLKTHTEEEFKEFIGEVPLYEDEPTPNHEVVFSHIRNKYAKYL